MSLVLERVVYMSEASRPDPGLVVLSDILATSDRNNRRDGLTGALVVTATQFLQILEGARQDIDRTLGRLRADTRHRQIEVLSRGPVDRRQFGQWTMVAARITPDEAGVMQDIVGLSRNDPDAACDRVQSLVEDQLRAD